MKFHFLLSILLLVSIGHPEGTSSQSPVELILKDTSGGPQDPQILVIKEQQSLKAFYSKVNQTRRPGLAIPKVNFKNEFIIILCMGTRQTAGYDISISATKVLKNTLHIYVKEEYPENARNLAKVLNEPFSIYRVKGTFKDVIFHKTEN
ncbi:protease complex subunit PrcB family protein [Flavobacteriaceae bacterium M23B6Z8]